MAVNQWQEGVGQAEEEGGVRTDTWLPVDRKLPSVMQMPLSSSRKMLNMSRTLNLPVATQNGKMT